MAVTQNRIVVGTANRHVWVYDVRNLKEPEQKVLNHTLEATLGQMDGFFSQLPYKCHLEEVASVGD